MQDFILKKPGSHQSAKGWAPWDLPIDGLDFTIASKGTWKIDFFLPRENNLRQSKILGTGK